MITKESIANHAFVIVQLCQLREVAKLRWDGASELIMGEVSIKRRTMH